MSVPYGKHWKIDGLIAGPITRRGRDSGSYSILFERANGVTLEKIEAVNWDKPNIQELPGNRGLPGLPEGYGFELESIEYHYNTRHFTVTVTTAKQYLGDVTGYQARIEELEGQNTALSGQVTKAEDQPAGEEEE